ncbi:hypothetical protein BMS3Abin17_01044 [archaeon BMS3Abin17]|nr:hypothetical protein BMS3Abin17_01044 [archaeon BMS3Abin17]HDZ60728.1 hypothetical protein [Candidatus Pacearchaeota archaeon]
MFLSVDGLLARFIPPGTYALPSCTIKCVNYENRACDKDGKDYASLRTICNHPGLFKKRTLFSRIKANIKGEKDIINKF